MLNKMRSDDLIAFSKDGEGRRVSVLVSARRDKPLRLNQLGGSAPGQASSSLDALEADLARLGLASQARRNDLAGMFALEVTAHQLQELARLRTVGAIRPNRFGRWRPEGHDGGAKSHSL